MKKIIAALCISIFSTSSFAQTFSNPNIKSLPFHERWGVKISAGYGTTSRYNALFFKTHGPDFSVEPQFLLMDNILIGARAEYAFMKSYISGNSGESGRTKRIQAEPIASFSLTGDFINPWKKPNWPFVGLGAGFYYLGKGQRVQNGEVLEEENLGTRFGISPRIGVNIRQFSIALEFHLIDEKVLYNRDYTTLKIGYVL